MLSHNQKQTIIKRLKDKGINNSTIQYVTDYCTMNSEIFADSINSNNLIDKLTTNLNKSIRYDMISPVFLGYSDPKKGKISLNPLMFAYGKKIRNSAIYHEMDHMATSKRIDLEKNKGMPYISGISDFCDNVALNEGITFYKQSKYEKYFNSGKGLMTKNKFSAYYLNLSFVKNIANVIGEGELIEDHFNNDFKKMCDAFKKETAGYGDLEQLSKEMDAALVGFHPIGILKDSISIAKEIAICQISKYHKELGLGYDEIKREEDKGKNIFALRKEKNKYANMVEYSNSNNNILKRRSINY